MVDNGTSCLLKSRSLVSHNNWNPKIKHGKKQHKLHKHFPPLLQNALRKIYKAHCERLHLLMINGITSDIHWLIKAKVWLAGKFSDPFVSYVPGFGKSTFAKKRRAKRLGLKCHNCVRLSCKWEVCKSLWMVKIKLNSLKIAWVKNHWMTSYNLLRSIEVDMCNVRFIICGYYSKKKVHNLVLGIWLKKTLFASL